MPPPLVSSVLLVLACTALGGAGYRVAATLATGWIERTVAAFTLACGAAAACSMSFGLVALGTKPGVLVAAALALWLVARLLLPAPTPRLGDQLREAWDRTPAARRAALGAAIGALALWTVWILRYPFFGFDGAHYHLAEVVRWLHTGRPGSVERVFPGFPVGSYPLVNEVLLSWGTAIGRTQLVAQVWTPLLVGVVGLAGWHGLRLLGARAPAAYVGLAGLCLTPVATYSVNAAETDVPALAWTVVTAALAAAAIRGRQPRLVIAVLVAAGLAVGTKTSALPLGLGLAVVTLVAVRADLRRLAVPVAAAALLAGVVGVFWYARNVIEHGSPIWPFLHLPGADPKPLAIRQLSPTFIAHPARMVREAGPAWVQESFGGGLIVVGLALVSPLLVRTRAVVLATGAAAVSVVLWMFAPTTGVTEPISVGNLSPRYGLPALWTATLAVCLAERHAPRRTRIALLAGLVASLAVNAWETFHLKLQYAPPVIYPLAGMAVGAGAAVAVRRLAVPRWVFAAGLPLAVALGFAAATPHVLDRYTRHGELGFVVGYVEHAQPTNLPVFMAPFMSSAFAGERATRTVERLPLDAPCSVVRRDSRMGLVLIQDYPLPKIFRFISPRHLQSCMAGTHALMKTDKIQLFHVDAPARR